MSDKINKEVVTVSSVLEELKYEPNYQSLDLDGMKLLTVLFGASDEQKAEMSKELNKSGLGAVLRKRVEVFKLTEQVSLDAMIFWLALGIEGPGELMLYLIEVLDFYSINNRAAVLNDFAMQIYPDGFYTDESARYIVSNVIKEGRATNGTIY